MLIRSEDEILPIEIGHDILPLNCLDILGHILQEIINTPTNRSFLVSGVENKDFLQILTLHIFLGVGCATGAHQINHKPIEVGVVFGFLLCHHNQALKYILFVE